MRTVANREHEFIQFWFNSEKMHAPLIYKIHYLISLCLEASVPLAFPGHQEWANLEKKCANTITALGCETFCFTA